MSQAASTCSSQSSGLTAGASREQVRRCVEEAESGFFNLNIQDLLARQFSHVHKALVAAQENVQAPLQTRWEAAQRMEGELRDLRVENWRLRACSSSPADFPTYTQMGGTGESCGASEVKTGGPAADVHPALRVARPPALQEVPVPRLPAVFRAPAPEDDAPEMGLPGCSDAVVDFRCADTRTLELSSEPEEPMVVQDVFVDARERTPKVAPAQEHPHAFGGEDSLKERPSGGHGSLLSSSSPRTAFQPKRIHVSELDDSAKTSISSPRGKQLLWSPDRQDKAADNVEKRQLVSIDAVAGMGTAKSDSKDTTSRESFDAVMNNTLSAPMAIRPSSDNMMRICSTNKSSHYDNMLPGFSKTSINIQSQNASNWCPQNSLYNNHSLAVQAFMQGSVDGQFELLDIWQHQARAYLHGVNRQRKGQKSLIRAATQGIAKLLSVVDKDPAEDCETEESIEQSNTSRHVPFNPSNPTRGTWDIFSLFLVIYDMGSIPLQFFEPPESLVSRVMEWLTRCFWTLDIVFSFMTGYVTMNGFIEMRVWQVAGRYARSWLVLDCTIVGVDWVEVVLKSSQIGGDGGYARLGRASRTFRIIRMVRLLRLVRMREVFALITERFNSERLIIVADITKLVVVILAVAHFIACSWYGIGVMDATDGDNWVELHGYSRSELAEKYVMSLHWSLSQFAGGMDEVTPENVPERTFAIVVFVFAFIMAALFVSSLTSSMTQLNIIGSETSKKLSVLGKYLTQNGITNKLAMRVKRNAQQALVEQQRLLPENNVSLLAMVSDPLRVEIHLEMYSPHFNIHPFFKAYVEECPMVMRKVCHLASSMLQVSTGDVIFSTGEIPAIPKMYIVCSGSLSYHLSNDEEFDVCEDFWISEACLWTSWRHRGLLVCNADCRLFELDAKKFQDIASQFEHSDFSPIEYAIEFVGLLNAEENPNDLPLGLLAAAESCETPKGVHHRLTLHQQTRTLQQYITDCIEAILRKMKVKGAKASASSPLPKQHSWHVSRQSKQSSKSGRSGQSRQSHQSWDASQSTNSAAMSVKFTT